MRDLTMKKKMRSKMKARRTIEAPIPEEQEDNVVMDSSRTWARRPKKAARAAKPRPTMCSTRIYVIHLTTTEGILIFNGRLTPKSACGSEGEGARRQASVSKKQGRYGHNRPHIVDADVYACHMLKLTGSP
jgi:hypothetical protein